jgi:protein ImuA
MPALKADIITQLKKDILALQGFRPLLHQHSQIELGTINHSFPNSQFPLGVNHEFICHPQGVTDGVSENMTASSGFIAGILSSLLQKRGAAIWISASQIIFPPALVSFGIEPSQIIFIHLKKQKEILWTIEEALKCDGLAAVVGEIAAMDLAVSRRLQLATEQSRVTGFLLRNNPKQPGTTACTCRWRIRALQSETENDLPGVGFARWKVELLKVRNGKTGQWKLEWSNGRFNEVITKHSSSIEEHKHAV